MRTSVRLEPVRDVPPAAEPGVGRLVARHDEWARADDEPTPIVEWDAMETALHQRPSPRDFASMLRGSDEPTGRIPDAPIELSDPMVYTLPDVSAPELAERDTDPEHTSPPDPTFRPDDESSGYDEVFPLRSDPRLAPPGPRPRGEPVGDETNALLQSTGRLGRTEEFQPTEAGHDPEEPGTQWMRRPGASFPPPGAGAPAGAAGARRPLLDEKTEIRGFSGAGPTFDDDDDAPTVIVPPPPGLGVTPPPEPRSSIPEGRPPAGEPTMPAVAPTVRLTRPEPPRSSPPTRPDRSAELVAWVASTIGVAVLVTTVGIAALALARWLGAW